MPVHAQGVGAFAQVESGSGESGRLGNGRVFLQIVELGRQGVHGVTERLKFAVSARLLSGGRSFHLPQQAKGAMDRKQSEGRAGEDQSTQDAQGKKQGVHFTRRSRSCRLTICWIRTP